MTEQSTMLITAAGKTGYQPSRPSFVGQLQTRTDADAKYLRLHISVNDVSA